MKEIKEAILQLREDVFPDKSAYDINCGYCDMFAELLVAELGDRLILLIESTGEYKDNCNDNKLEGVHHFWVTYNGRHYAAECPGGVDAMLELPIFKRHLNKVDNERGC